MTDLNATPVEAWQAWIAVEHEAVWLYSLVGGRVDDVADSARASWNRHRDTRDRLAEQIRSAGAEPEGPQLSYPETIVNSVDDARRAAETIEARVQIAAVACISDPTHRPEVVAALRASARAAATWGATPTAFPGLS